MSENTIHIAFSTDEKGAMRVHFTMKTLFDSNRGEDILVHIITDGLKPETSELLYQLARHFNRQIDILTISDDDIQSFDLPTLKNSLWGPAAAYRLILGKLFPNLHRILYLDTDLLIRKSLRPLWDTDLGDNVIAGVKDRNPFEYNRRATTFHKRLDYPAKYGYINSGVILYDLDKYRQMGFDKILLNDIVSNGDRYKYFDQDAINKNLHFFTKHLPFTYNVSLDFYWFNGKNRPILKDQLELTRDPAIIHFISHEKPWHKMRKGGFYLKRKTVERYISMEPATPGLLDQEYAPKEQNLKHGADPNPDNQYTNPSRGRERERERERDSAADRLKVALAKTLIAIGIYDYIHPCGRWKLHDPYPD
jgi:lipopolysaccharide biosynthesis glycosyltransferase